MPPTEDTEDTSEGTEETTLETVVAPETTADVPPEVTGEDNDDSDPFEIAYEARRELERETDRARIAAETRAQLQQEAQDRAYAAAQQQDALRLRETFADVLKDARTGLSKITVKTDDNEELSVGITDQAFEDAVAKPLQRFNSIAEQTFTTRVYNELAEAASSVLPVETHEDFNKKASGQSLPQWIQTLVETQAPHTEYAKTLQREVDVKVKAAEARGYARGQKAPAGVPKTGESRVRTGNSDLSSWSGAASALARGDITDGEFRDLVKKFRSTT